MDIKAMISEMTLEEKAGLCSGGDFWFTKAVERLGVPAMMFSDGPNGLRKQDIHADHLGINESIKAVCFPAGCAVASSFDRALFRQMGSILGRECQAEHIGVLLGPAVNIKRSPLCGRNFEYLSEDPCLAGEMAAAYIAGVQNEGVGTSIKHFFANNQEHRRMSSSSEMDERTAREIYLAPFETAVKKAQPWTIMTSYNRINGTYSSADKHLLEDILRKEWGFAGVTISDWGAVDDRVEDLKAGLDIEMPSSYGFRDKEIAEAVRSGALDEAELDKAVERILTLVDKAAAHKREAQFDRTADHQAARDIAAQCMVLLKNEQQVLPLGGGDSAAFIGLFADKPRFQGGGSAHINSSRIESAVSMAQGRNVIYAQGYTEEDQPDAALLEEAIRTASRVKTAVIFAGLPDSFESEGYDRRHMRLPKNQELLIHAVAATNPRTVVVLHGGAPVEMPWINEVQGVLYAYLGGQAVGGAAVRVLYGDVNPAGHLAETFPLHLEDNPSYLFYQGEDDRTEYREGIFIGYRYYMKKKMPVLFPFGYGLSYTTFTYNNLRAVQEGADVRVEVDVTNSGSRDGKAVVQLYVLPPQTESVIRPVSELRDFAAVPLKAGETQTVSFTLPRRAFAYFNTEKHDWCVPEGDYGIAIGENCIDLVQQLTLHIEGEKLLPRRVTLNTTFADILRIPGSEAIIAPCIEVYTRMQNGGSEQSQEAISPAMVQAMLGYSPVRAMLSFGGGEVTPEMLEDMLRQLNALLPTQAPQQ